jgi:hypothetical protein
VFHKGFTFHLCSPEAFAPGETLISNNSSTVFLQVGANVKLRRKKTAMMTCSIGDPEFRF